MSSFGLNYAQLSLIECGHNFLLDTPTAKRTSKTVAVFALNILKENKLFSITTAALHQSWKVCIVRYNAPYMKIALLLNGDTQLDWPLAIKLPNQ